MDKRLKIELTALTKEKWCYRVLEGKSSGIFEGILIETSGQEEKDDKVPGLARLWIVVHPVEEFLCGEESKTGMNPPLAQDLLLSRCEKDNGECFNQEQLPIIHITTTDIFLLSMYTSKPLHRLVPRYHLIVDNSIWNYHVSIFNEWIIRDKGKEQLVSEVSPEKQFYKTTIRKEFRQSFHDALESIKKNYDRHLYTLQVAKEYADLNARMSAQAYLEGAHANGVSPFVFHSEDVVKQMIDDEFQDKAKALEQIKEHKWRILLVDDKAKKPMEPKEEYEEDKIGDLPWNCKLSIIEKTLRHCIGWEKDNEMMKIRHRPCKEEIGKQEGDGKEDAVTDDCQILIEYAQTLATAKEALKARTYDIILLDYLLDNDEKHYQNYGFTLLNELYNDRDQDGNFKYYKPCPSERFFFMFISAYTTAVYERLRAETLNLSEDYWHISLGACPTNTPQLFLYNLLKLMEKRLKDSGVNALSVSNLGKLMRDIYENTKGGNSVRKRANKLYEKVLSCHYHYRRIMKDVSVPTEKSVFETNGSVLMTEFAKKHQNLGGLLEHMANLVHITAFGTIRQWPEMWEEYLYFKSLYNQLFKAEFNNTTDTEQRDNMYSEIEDYILILKNGQDLKQGQG